ncbi:MAG TPA: hypothetical protein VGM17_07610 [Rhizomicrobium sp.]|jgi:hypothetical protein
MNAFDYLSVLISIVLGLGITQLLTGFAGLVRARKRIRMYWPVPVQIAVVFLIAVVVWWSMFGLREVRVWTFGLFLVVLGQAVAAYLMAAFITPDAAGTEHLILRELYFREARWFFSSSLALLAFSVAKNLMLSGSMQSGDLVGHVAFAAVSLAGLIGSGDRVHKIIAPLTFVFLAVYIGALFVQLPH